MAAKRDDWKTITLPTARTSISLDRTYTADEFERICEGNIPQEMEDKWFAFYEEPWLYLHRSWSGFCIYQVRFERTGIEVHVAEVLVSREAEQYKSKDGVADSLLLAVLLDGYAGRDTEPAWERYMTSRR